MTYSETLDWLFSQLPMYQRTGGANYKIDLQKTFDLMDALDHPESKFKSIHIAGTNGKGSTSHMLASCYQEAGYKVGLYTSPHLIDFRERIRINGEMIPENMVVEFVQRHKQSFVEMQLSFFEMTVGMAFDYFAKEKVDLAIIETGMGGRLDSTNVIKPLVSVITNIGLDHQKFLGDTLDKIAFEKAGIIKKETPVIIGETQPEIKSVFTDKAKELNAPIFFADQLIKDIPESDLTGYYQRKNIKTTLATIQKLSEFKLEEEHIKKGLLHVVRNTGLAGRWQKIQDHPTIICDTAHNEEGIKEVLRQIKDTPHNKLHLVWGMVDDKDIPSILKMLPSKANFYFTQPSIPRALKVDILQEHAESVGLIGSSFPMVKGSAYFFFSIIFTRNDYK